MDKAAKIIADQLGVFIMQGSYDQRLWETLEESPAPNRLGLLQRTVWPIATSHREERGA